MGRMSQRSEPASAYRKEMLDVFDYVFSTDYCILEKHNTRSITNKQAFCRLNRKV
jgi:hypothetical protein